MAIVAPVAPPTVSPLPTPPSSTSPMDFDPRADAFLGALPTNQTQMNSLGTNVYNNALKTYNSANDTATSATSAVTASNSATASANIAQQSLSDMQKLYLGSKNSPPTEDNQGNPLQVGAWFVNSLQGYWYWWSGTDWKLGMSDLGSVDWATQVTSKPNTLPGYGIVNQPQARTDLGLKSAAIADILGVVSQSGGVPTGALMQYGTNANGEFWRFASGLQVCASVISVAASSISANNTANLGSSAFPAAFITAPRMCVVQWGGAFVESVYCASSWTVSSANIYGRNLSSSAVTWSSPVSVYITTIGRWF